MRLGAEFAAESLTSASGDAGRYAAKMSRQLITATLKKVLHSYGFTETEDSNGSMGGWFFQTESDLFIVTAGQDRSGDGVGICVGSKKRRKPRAHMRGPWSLSHLRGYIDENADHFMFDNADDQIGWLKSNLQTILDTEFLNSDELNNWAVKASRRLFGQNSP